MSEQWYLFDGRHTVGPYDTPMLLRAYVRGRIRDDDHVWRAPWATWRRVDSLRELSPDEHGRFDRASIPTRPVNRFQSYLDRAAIAKQIHGLVGVASDEDELINAALAAAARVTRAEVGLAHRVTDGDRTLLTSCALGFDAVARLGETVPRTDPAVQSARIRTRVIDAPAYRRDGAATCARFASRTLQGTALVPLHARAKLIGVLELARTDHPFRSTDVARLSAVGKAVDQKATALLAMH